MGDRFFLDVVCPGCKREIEDAYYAPTCGMKTETCLGCGMEIDLEEYTGITEADASNAEEIEAISRRIMDICDCGKFVK